MLKRRSFQLGVLAFRFSGQQVTPENYFTTRVDHNFSKPDTLYGTYMFDSATVQQPDELNDKRAGYDSRRQAVTLHNSGDQLNPTLIFANENRTKGSRQASRRKCAYFIHGMPFTSGFIAMILSPPG